MPRPQDEPLLKLWHASWRLSRNAEQALAEIGLARSEIVVMLILRAGGMVQSSLARAAGMPESTLSDVIDRLERMFYVKREADVFDGRYKYVALTRIVGQHAAEMAFEAIQEIEFRVDPEILPDSSRRLIFGNRLRDRVRPRRPSKRPRGRSRLDGVL